MLIQTRPMVAHNCHYIFKWCAKCVAQNSPQHNFFSKNIVLRTIFLCTTHFLFWEWCIMSRDFVRFAWKVWFPWRRVFPVYVSRFFVLFTLILFLNWPKQCSVSIVEHNCKCQTATQSTVDSAAWRWVSYITNYASLLLSDAVTTRHQPLQTWTWRWLAEEADALNATSWALV